MSRFVLGLIAAILAIPFNAGAQDMPPKQLAANSPIPATPSNNGGDDEATTWALPPTTSVEDVLQVYERLTGKRVVRDSTLAQGVPLSIKVNGPIKKSEAIRLIESTLLLNGFAMIPGPDGSVKAVNGIGGKNFRSEGVPIYANAASLPQGEQVVSYFMALRYMSAVEAATIFTQHAAIHQPWGMIVPIPNAQALVITENTSVIRQLIQFQKLIDVPPAKVVSEFVPLMRADAERVADMLTKMLEARRNSQTALGQAPAPSPEFGDDAVPMNERSIVAGTVQLVADARTNRILVVTRPVNFNYIKELILQFDEAASLNVPFERKLKYIASDDVLPALQKALAETKEDAQGTANGAPGQNNQNRNTPTRSSSSSSSGSGTGSNSAAADSIQANNQDSVPDAIMVGKTKLIADKRANSILVIGPPESVSRVRDILDKLDTAPRQVYLATVIGELSLINDTEFGIDLLQKWSGHHTGVASQLRNTATAAAGSSIEPSALTTAAAFPTAAGLTVYGSVGSTLNYYVTALESSNRFKILSRPSVYISNNQKATISSGQQVPVPGQTESTANTGNISTNSTIISATVEYKNVDLELSVVPLINADKEVTLQIGQDNNTLGINYNIGGNEVPAINTQHFTTSVTVPNRQTVVLGGLIQNNVTRDVSGTLWLSDIPVIGLLFKDTAKTFTRREIIILIEPNVIDTKAELADASLEEQSRALIGGDAYHMNDKGVFIPNDEMKIPKATKTTKNQPAQVLKTEPAPAPINAIPTTQPAPPPSEEPATPPSMPISPQAIP